MLFVVKVYLWLEKRKPYDELSVPVGEYPVMVKKKKKKSKSISMALSEILGCELGHAGGCVIPSENISKQWKIRNIWKWDHEEWELYSRLAIDFFFF